MIYEAQDPVEALGMIEVAVDDPETVGSVLAFAMCTESLADLNAFSRRLGRDQIGKQLSATDRNVVRSVFAELRRAHEIVR